MKKTELINRTLVSNAGVSNRSEDLENYRELFVDPIDSDILLKNTKQLIYGRRGSGKTLVIGALNEAMQQDVAETKVMSFSYSALNFRSSAEYGGLIPTVKEKTHAYFHSFILQLSGDFFNLADDILKKPNLLDYFKLNGPKMAAKREQLASAVLELMEASSYGSERPLPTSLRILQEKTSTSQDKTSISAEVKTESGISLTDPKIGIDAYTKMEGSAASENILLRKLVYETERCFNPSKVKELLLDVIDILGLKYIIIFLDEWMSLAECQVEFAERLKQCLFGESKISIKIAADPYQGEFNNSGKGHNFRGLEIGGDIFEAVNLDFPFRDRDRQVELFSLALYKRLSHLEPKLKDIFGNPPKWNSDYFIRSLFSNKRAFVELCNGAQGLCRDFHVLFQKCSKLINWDVSKQKIDFNCVRKVVFKNTEETYGRIIKSIDSNRILFDVIRPHIMKNKSRYFIFESKPNEYSAIIKNLLTKRIIHHIPMSRMHSTLRGKYDCFEIDYGIFSDLSRAMEFSTGEKMDEEYNEAEVSRITASNKAHYLLHIDKGIIVDKGTEIILCDSCGKEFSSDEKAYQVRRICPYCFMDQ